VRDCTLTHDTAENQYPRPTDRPTDPPTMARRRDATRHLRRRRRRHRHRRRLRLRRHHRLFARSHPPFPVAVAFSQTPMWPVRSGTNDQLVGTGCGQVKKQPCFPPRMSREAKCIYNEAFLDQNELDERNISDALSDERNEKKALERRESALSGNECYSQALNNL